MSTWKRYQEGLAFMRKNDLLNTVTKNERFYAGQQWYGVKAKDLPKPVFNICKRVTNFKIASVMSESIKMSFSVQGYAENMDKIPEYEEGADLFTRYSDTMWEKLKQTALNEQMLLDSALSGAGIIHYYWDNSVQSGNDVMAVGEVVGETIDSVNYFAGNPNEPLVQSQPYIIISYRELVSKIKEEAKQQEGMTEEKLALISPDEETQDEGFDKAQHELGEKTTVLLEYYKKDGQVFFRKATKSVEIVPETPTGLKLYPLVLMNWGLRKRSCYGTAEISEIIPNQLFINKTFAMWMVSMQRTAFPKVVYDKSRIANWSNGIGVGLGVEGDISNVAKYLDTGQVNYDVYKLIDAVMQYTKELAGANENALGETRPENTSALIAQQKASAIPLESIKRRFYQAVEDIGLIWSDFWKSKYNTTRAVNVKNKDANEVEMFNGTDYQDINFDLKIDVGASNQWSEILMVNVLDNLLQTEKIDFVEFLEMYPNGIIPKKQQLIERRKQQDIEAQVLQQCMAEFYKKLPLEAQEQLQSMKPEEMEQKLLELMSQQSTQ